MPSTLLSFTVYRGLRFNGFRGIALDSAGSPVVFNAGTTGLMQARRAPNKPLAFSMPVSLGQANGELIIDAMDAEDTAVLPLGEYQHDLILTDSAGQSTGPFSHGIITVKKPISAP
jgi:hypothetical protein